MGGRIVARRDSVAATTTPPFYDPVQLFSAKVE